MHVTFSDIKWGKSCPQHRYLVLNYVYYCSLYNHYILTVKFQVKLNMNPVQKKFDSMWKDDKRDVISSWFAIHTFPKLIDPHSLYAGLIKCMKWSEVNC